MRFNILITFNDCTYSSGQWLYTCVYCMRPENVFMVVYEFQDSMRHLSVCLCDVYVKADVCNIHSCFLVCVEVCVKKNKKTTDCSHVLYKGTQGPKKGILGNVLCQSQCCDFTVEEWINRARAICCWAWYIDMKCLSKIHWGKFSHIIREGY